MSMPAFAHNVFSSVDFGKTVDDYKTFRHGFPKTFYQKLLQKQIGLNGQKILDLGTGTGTIARTLAAQGAKVWAIDKSSHMIKTAEQLAHQANLTIQFEVAEAEKLPFADNFFDVVIAGQCWHWFDEKRALSEVKRVLRKGGIFVIAHFDWLNLKYSVGALSEQLILQYNPQWHGYNTAGFHPLWADLCAQNGFSQIETHTFDEMEQYTHESWRGRIRACAGVAASLSKDMVESFDHEHTQLLKQHFKEEVLMVPHRCFILTAVL